MPLPFRAPAVRPHAPGFLPRLAAPPRHVPLSLRVRLLFGGLGVFAWLWLAFGSGFATVFLREAALGDWLAFRGDLVHVDGESLGCRETNARENRTRVYANRYTFESGGRAFEAVSYATGDCIEAGQTVVVEHPSARPEVSRLTGMRRAPFGPGVVFVLIFPGVGLGLVAASLVLGRRQLRLLANGRLVLGTLVSQEATNVSVNNRRVMKLRFAVDAGAGVREVEVRTSQPEVLEDEPKERILLDPDVPGRATAWDLLPGPPPLDPSGQLEPAGGFRALLLLLPPAIAVAVHAAALLAG